MEETHNQERTTNKTAMKLIMLVGVGGRTQLSSTSILCTKYNNCATFLLADLLVEPNADNTRAIQPHFDNTRIASGQSNSSSRVAACVHYS